MAEKARCLYVKSFGGVNPDPGVHTALFCEMRWWWVMEVRVLTTNAVGAIACCFLGDTEAHKHVEGDEKFGSKEATSTLFNAKFKKFT